MRLITSARQASGSMPMILQVSTSEAMTAQCAAPPSLPTKSAFLRVKAGGRMMGLTTAEMLTVSASLSRRQFHKSMTTYADNRVWQDVYHAATPVR